MPAGHARTFQVAVVYTNTTTAERRGQPLFPAEQLVRAVFPSSLKDRYLAVFTAYFDASGNRQMSVMSVTGFVSRAAKWIRFEKRWRSLLPESISMFHMTDFASSYGGWEAWKGESAKRVALIESLVSCAKAHTNQGFSATMRLSEYAKVDHVFQLKERHGSPYAILCMACLAGLKQWADKKQIDWQKILCVFESGDEQQGDLIIRARQDGFNAIPQSKKDIRAFDVCDLVAWKSRAIINDAKELKLYREGPDAAGRILRALDQVETIVKGRGAVMFSANALTQVCIHDGIPKRPQVAQ